MDAAQCLHTDCNILPAFAIPLGLIEKYGRGPNLADGACGLFAYNSRSNHDHSEQS